MNKVYCFETILLISIRFLKNESINQGFPRKRELRKQNGFFWGNRKTNARNRPDTTLRPGLRSISSSR